MKMTNSTNSNQLDTHIGTLLGAGKSRTDTAVTSVNISRRAGWNFRHTAIQEQEANHCHDHCVIN